MANACEPGPPVHHESSAPGLTRSRVLVAAIDMIDSDGLAALTMRRLGHSLGVEAMAVYHYVSGRDDLLDGVVGVLTQSVREVTLPPGNTDWRGYLGLLATACRDLVHAHPAAFPLLLTNPVAAQWWLRAPLHDPVVHQRFLHTLLRCGFSVTETGTAYRGFTSFLTGHLSLESASITAHPLRDDPEAALRRAAEGQSDFDSSFAALINRLAAPVARIPLQRTGSGMPLPPSA